MKKEHLLLVFFILLKFLLQYLSVNPDFNLHRDEFLHLDQAKHLAWGYLSVPPFTSWNSVLIQWLGGGEFWVRFFPALYGVLTILLIWDLVKKLGGNLYAQSLAAIGLICSALIRLNILYQPNSVDILCYTLVFYTLIRWVQTEQTKWLYFLGFSFAVGILNKYNIAFLGMGLFPALVISRPNLFKNIHLLGALILVLVMISPNLIWQFQNQFPVLTHMSLLSKTQLVNNDRMGFLTEQLLFFYPSLFIWVPGLIALGLSKNWKKYRFVFWSYVFTLGIFTFFKAKGYYAIGLYPVLIGIGSVVISKGIDSLEKWNSSHPVWISRGKLALSILVLIIPLALFFPAFTLIHPFYSPAQIQKNPPPYSLLGLNRWEDGKEHPIPQDFADMLGWSELASLVDSAYAAMPKGSRTLIICDNYGQAGGINFYTKTPGLEALTMNADYLYWFDLSEPIDNLILVWEKDEQITEREINFFDEYREIGKISHPMARELGTTVHFLKGAKMDIGKVLEQEIQDEKAIWEGKKEPND